MIPFNVPYNSHEEIKLISKLIHEKNQLSGNGNYSKKCQSFLEEKYGFKKTLLTTSCTDALEMCSILANIQDGDEVIIPSYAFVSTANPFILRGAKIVFADSKPNHPNINEDEIEGLITNKTKAIVVIHYAGVACDMDKIMHIASKHKLLVIEDAAHGIDSYYKGNPLGSIGDFGTFSFHETKNIQCGEGGLIVINNETFIKRSEIISEKGTNRSAFLRGEINKYEWLDIGSSYFPSELNAAYLYAQLKQINKIQQKRVSIYNKYYSSFKDLEKKGRITLPVIPKYATNNAHTFYFTCKSMNERILLIEFLKQHNIQAAFHYLGLHKSSYYKSQHDERSLVNSDYFEANLIRLPLFVDLNEDQIEHIILSVMDFFK